MCVEHKTLPPHSHLVHKHTPDTLIPGLFYNAAWDGIKLGEGERVCVCVCCVYCKICENCHNHADTCI